MERGISTCADALPCPLFGHLTPEEVKSGRATVARGAPVAAGRRRSRLVGAGGMLSADDLELAVQQVEVLLKHRQSVKRR